MHIYNIYKIINVIYEHIRYFIIFLQNIFKNENFI